MPRAATHHEERARSRLALACLVLAAALAGCGSRPPERTNLVVVTVDTLRADHLGCYGYFRDTSPNLDRFAAESVLFESVFAPMATTLPTHVSLFTGLFPLEHQVVANIGATRKPFVWRPGMRTVAQLAKERGFMTAGFVSATPLKAFTGISVGFDVYDEPPDATRPAGQTLERVMRWLSSGANPPFFLWVHFYDPHRPLVAPPEHAVFAADADLERHLAEREVPASGVNFNGALHHTRADFDAYDAEVRYVDDRIGALLRTLRELGFYDRSVIVLTADHGEGLNQHDWPDHGGTWAEQLHVPLLMRFPDPKLNRIGRVRELVSTVDILPTALARVDAPLAERFAEQATGVDALADDYRARPLLSRRTAGPDRERAGPLYALTTPEWRFLYEPNASARLFDRTRDPFELRDQVTARPDVAETLRRETAALIGAQAARAEELGTADPAAAAPLDPELIRQLEALGYTTK